MIKIPSMSGNAKEPQMSNRRRVVIDATSSRAAPATSARKVNTEAANKKDHLVSGQGPADKRDLPSQGRFYAAPAPSARQPPPRATQSSVNIFSTEQPRRANSVTLARPVEGAVQRPSCRRFCPRQTDSIKINDASTVVASAPRSATPPCAGSTFLRFDGEDPSSVPRFGLRMSPNVNRQNPLVGILPGDAAPATPQRRPPLLCDMEKLLTGDPSAPSPRCSSLRTNVKQNSPPSVDWRRSTGATLRHPIATPQPSTLFGSDQGQRAGKCSWDFKFSAMYRPQGSYLIRHQPLASQRNKVTEQSDSGLLVRGKKRSASAPRSQTIF